MTRRLITVLAELALTLPLAPSALAAANELPKCNDGVKVIPELRSAFTAIDSLDPSKTTEGPRVPNMRQCRAFVTTLGLPGNFPRSFWVTYTVEWNGTARPEIWLTHWTYERLEVGKLPRWPSERMPEEDNQIVEPTTCRANGEAIVFEGTSPNSRQFGRFTGDKRISTTGITRLGWSEVVFGRSDTKGWVHRTQLKDCTEN